MARPGLLLIGLAPVLLGGALALGALLGPATSTETRYAEMGREMYASGDLVVPTLDGAPHVEKPPLAPWALALTFLVLGVGDAAARVPSLLAGVLTVLAIAIGARRLSPAVEGHAAATRRGLVAALALATMPSFVAQATTISTDVWLVLSTTLAGLALLEADRAGGRAGWGPVLLLHGALGLGMLAKGPLALALVLGAALVVAAVRRDARILRPFVNPAGLLLLLAVSVPWYLAADARIPGLLDALVRRRLFGGLASSADFHARPVWVVWIPLLGTFPWLAALVPSIGRLRREGRWLRGPGVVAAALALAAPVLFTFSRSRLVSYASPAFPWVALLVALGLPARGATGAAEDDAAWGRQLALATIGVSVACLGVVIAMVARHTDAATLAVGAVAAGGALVAALAPTPRRARRGTIGRAALATAAMLLAAGALLAQEPLLVRAGKPLWQAIERHRTPGDELGAELPYSGDWGLLPWFAREHVRYFGFPSDAMVVPPERSRPDLFLPKEAVRAWFFAPERRFLLVRTHDPETYFGDLPTWVVATGAGYAVLTNQPLADSAARGPP